MDLEAVWQQLGKIKNMRVAARCFCFPPTFPKRDGKGKVVTTESEESLVFCERGSWSDESRFTNIFRWTCDREKEEIRLDHLRFGIEKPIHLFSLVPSGPHHLKSIEPREYGEDIYSGILSVDEKALQLTWRIQGPKKNQEVVTVYS